MISRIVWTANSDGTLTPELMAVNSESHCRTSKVEIISHGPSVRHSHSLELELELIQTQMAQKPMLRAEVGMRVRCANKASAE